MFTARYVLDVCMQLMLVLVLNVFNETIHFFRTLWPAKSATGTPGCDNALPGQGYR